MCVFTCSHLAFAKLNPGAAVRPQASMTGSALSLYLEETKTDEDSMFQPEISLIKKEGVAENHGNLNSLTGAREQLARGQGEPADVLATNTSTTLALHKVVSSVLRPNQEVNEHAYTDNHSLDTRSHAFFSFFFTTFYDWDGYWRGQLYEQDTSSYDSEKYVA